MPSAVKYARKKQKTTVQELSKHGKDYAKIATILLLTKCNEVMKMRLTAENEDGTRAIQFSQKEISELVRKKVPKGYRLLGNGGCVDYKGKEQWQVDIKKIQ